ncbi:MAG TPA: hypothetical protein VFZ20_18685 [Longimicrobium sp.]|nr:hypothetical protein [Longimicrobium sp.]
MTRMEGSPTRVLERLLDRFGVFEVLATSSVTLARCGEADELPMDPQVAEAVLEFGEDLREAAAAAAEWAGRGAPVAPRPGPLP